MKKRILILLCFITIGIQLCSAQNQNKIDSLLNVLKTGKEDTGKVNSLRALGMELMYSNPDTAIILGNQALSLAKKLEWKRGISNTLWTLGYFYFLKGNYSKSLDFNFNALKTAEELGDKKIIATALGNIGNVYENQSDYPKALDSYLKALKMAEEVADKRGIARHLTNIGNIYCSGGDYPKALNYYFKALKMAEELGNKLIQANNIGNIGTAYYQQKDYPKALDYYFKDLNLRKELGDKNGEAMALGNIGIIYSIQGDYTKALDYQLHALNMREELGDKKGMAETLGNIGLDYTLTGKFKEAESYLKKAIALDDSIGALNDLRQFEESLSKLYDTTAQLAVSKGQFALAAEKYKLAMMHYKKAMALKDTLFNQEKNDEITRKEMNYEFDKKEVATKTAHEKQLAVADVEIKKQRQLKYSFIGILGLVIVVLLFGYRVYRSRQILRLQAIRNKISGDLHDDIGSTLNSISIYSEVARKKDEQQDEALEMIGDASRKVIDAMSDIVWTINPDNDSFAKIIFRMKSLAYNLFRAKKIEFTFHADEILNEKRLSIEERRNFYLIFKEAVNNLVKYSNATRVAITLLNENDFIKLRIKDDGVGFDMSEDNAGNGLKSMKRRADEMKAEFKIESSKGNGTQIELILKA